MKSKRFLTILLSLAIMLTFMPSMVFAANDEPAHAWKADAAKSKKATCSEAGYTVYNCEADGCNVTKGEYNAAIDHVYGNRIRYTKVEYLSAVIAEGNLTKTQLKTLENSLANACYLYAKTCKMCGQLERTGSTYAYDAVGTTHTVPSGTPECAETYVCDVCGQTVTRTTTHNFGDWEMVQKNVCAKNHGQNNVDGIEVQARTCKDCGKVETRARTTVVYRYNHRDYPAGTVLGQNEDFDDEYSKYHCAHNITPVDPQPTGAEQQAKYVRYTGVYYEPNHDVTAATCTSTGTKDLVCPDCGCKVGTHEVTVPKLAHNWTDKVSPVTCTNDGFTQQVCADCGALGTTTAGEKKLGHDYKVTVVTEPNCEYDGLTIISCSRCSAYRLAGNTNANITTVNKVNYFKGFIGNGELYNATAAKPYENCIVIADWAKGAHKWGAYEDYQEATCLTSKKQAKKCSVCGSFDAHGINGLKEVGDPLGHDVVVEEHAATCGNDGWTDSFCKRCRESLDKDGKSVAEGADPDKLIWNVTKPVVAYGTDCQYEWKVLEEATPFKLGTRAKVCTVCENELYATKESIAKTKIAAPKVKALKKKAKVTVKAVEGAVKYQILVNGKVSKTVKKAGTFTVKKGIKKGKKNTFKIVAFNAEGVKATSAAKSVKIKK